MTRNASRSCAWTGGLLLVGALLTACTDYTLETTLRPDGSGVREMRVEVSVETGHEVTPEEYRTLMHLTEAEGWRYTGAEVDEDGDTTHIFNRRMEIADLEGWSRVSGTVAIDAALPEDADKRVGYVRLGDVKLRNEIQVGRGRTSAGTTTLSYRETFTWDYGLDVLLEFFVQAAERRFQEVYPRLPGKERGQILGALRTRIWMMVDAGILEASEDEEDAATRVAAASIAEQAVQLLRDWYPDVQLAEVEELVLEVLSLDGMEEHFMPPAPGLDLTFNTHVTVRVRMPGQVTESNASREEDGALVWEFEADNTLEGPVEIRAASVVGG